MVLFVNDYELNNCERFYGYAFFFDKICSGSIFQTFIVYLFCQFFLSAILPIPRQIDCGRCIGLMVSSVVSGSSGPGLSLGRRHCVVLLGKTLYSHSASLHSGV